MKIAVCLHLYHHDMWDEIKGYLNNIDHPYKLYVNMCQKNNHIENLIRSYKSDSVIIVSPNKGMDIGGFLYTYKHVDKDTDLVLKLHTKKGLGDNNRPSNTVKKYGLDHAKRIGSRWFKCLMDGVLKNKEQVNRIINEFKNNLNCGMVGFKMNSNYDRNINEMEKLFHLFNMKSLPNDPYFVGGTSFWVDNRVYKKYFTDEVVDKLLDLLPEGYVPEPSPNHAMERIFGCVVYNEKKELKMIV